MSISYRVFTAESGTITAGAVIEDLHLKGSGIDIPVVMIGEEGRGRERGVVPVSNPPMTHCSWRGGRAASFTGKCPECGTQLVGEENSHPNTGMVRQRLMFAEVGQTKAGKPKLVSAEKATTNDYVIVIFRTKIGFRGGNSHTGDRAGWKCSQYGCDASGDSTTIPEACPKCGGRADGYRGPTLSFAGFPGQIIARGFIAQGTAGRMGGGEQIVAIIPREVVFRTAYSGRLYGAPGSHYYKWDGERLLAATWSERTAADLF